MGAHSGAWAERGNVWCTWRVMGVRDLLEMTADLWGGGERVPEFDRYSLLLPRSCSLTLPVPLSSRALSSRLL
ncbi:unnamed protein product [Staurois parvus]|uniref:Uncharacterized protein n=1 Tax=Staurois parvus TaxID=386267 RepID=A0ABN9ETM2_9NEOB|nr:unnamed protein product [Staurois parvus]